MTPLALGIGLFLGVHMVPVAVPLRSRLRAWLGAQGYRGLFSLLSAAGLGLLIYGKARAPFVDVWPGYAGALPLSHALMPIVFVLFAAANMPTHLRARLRHPMLLGVILWAGVHLLANGDLASILLFGSFAAWGIVDLISASMRGQTLMRPDKPPSLRFDAVAIVSGLALFWVVARYHAVLFGPPVM